MASVQIASYHRVSQLAFSRRHGRVLAVESSGLLQIHRLDEEGRLRDAVATDCRISTEFRDVLAVAAEVLDTFIVIQSSAADCLATAVDVSGGTLVALRLGVGEVTSLDVFHNRSELLLGLRTGRVVSFSLRRPPRLKERERPGFQIYHRLTHVLERGVTPVQLRAQDLLETALVLHSDGAISCVDAASFEALWLVPSHSFFSPPKALFADRLSSHFAVYCEADRSPRGRGSMEIWHIPRSFSCGDSARFNRRIVPLPEAVCCAEIESIGKGLGVLVCVVLQNANCLFLRMSDDLDSLLLETTCALPFAMFSCDQLSAVPIHFVRPSASAPTSSVAVYLALCSDSIFLRLHCLKNDCSHPYSALKNHHIDEFHRIMNSTQRASTNSEVFNISEFEADRGFGQESVMANNEIINDDLPTFPAIEGILSTLENGRGYNPTMEEPLSQDCFKIVEHLTTSNSKVLFTIDPFTTISYKAGATNANQLKWDLRYATNIGLFIEPSPLKIRAYLLQPQYIAYASRASKFAVLSSLNDAYMFSLESETVFSLQSEDWLPLRSRGCTSFLLADIEVQFFKSNDSAELLSALKTKSIPEQRHDNYMLLLAGDDVGTVYHLMIDGRYDVQKSGSFTAHSGAIQSVLCTGDAMSAMVKVGVDIQRGDICELPGSSVLTLGKNGEIKVWSLKLTMSEDVDEHDFLLGISCSFLVSGVIHLKNLETDLTGGCLDPTCMSLIVSTGRGKILCLDFLGHVVEERSPLSWTKEAIVEFQVHTASVSSMRVSMLSPSDVRVLRVDEVKDEGSLPMLLPGPKKFTIGYTLQELKYRTLYSSMVTCSYDGSLVLWEFIIDSVKMKTFVIPSPRQR